MDLIKLMNYAWDKRVNLGAETLQEHCVNLLSHAYVDMNGIYYEHCRRENRPTTNINFRVFETIMIALMKCDGDFLQGEYDAYIKFCNYCGYQYKSANEIRSMNVDFNQVVSCIKLIISYRREISYDHYEALILAFCYLSLLGDKSFDENEYYIIRCFFEEELDYCPSDWQTFKREWK